MPKESIMGIARDLTVTVMDKLSTAGSAEQYGERIGRLYRTILQQVELGRIDVLSKRNAEVYQQNDEPIAMEDE
ncbi:MAG: hypothetical protein PHQ86_06620 [Dehalococcoidales bacterium]|nr:hypothetical protein [Dehalococcoidales bacterium]